MVDVHLAGVVVMSRGSDDDVAKAIAVHVSRRPLGLAKEVASVFAAGGPVSRACGEPRAIAPIMQSERGRADDLIKR